MFKCPDDYTHDIFIVFPGTEEEDPDGLGVQVTQTGDATDFWGDGVKGVPEILQELAEEETTAICAFCRSGKGIEWKL
jgi:hypothetical protein